MILIDVAIPGFSVSEDCLDIRNLFSKTRHTPIFAIRANSPDKNMKNLKPLGFDDVINKPFSPAQLTQKLHIWEEKIEINSHQRSPVNPSEFVELDISSGLRAS